MIFTLTFSYSNYQVEIVDDAIHARIDVKNSSDITGIETVQCYIHDIAGSVARPVSELKQFKSIEIKANDKVTVSFRITKEVLKFHNNNLDFVFEEGEFEIMVGANSESLEKKTIYFR